MKILHVITQSELGGAQRHVRDLVRWQRTTRQVEVACGGNGPLLEAVRSLGVRTHTVGDLVREVAPVHDLTALWSLRSLIRAGDYDIVHCHSTKAGLLGRIAARLSGVQRIVFTAHGFAFNEPSQPLKRAAYEKLELVGSRLCNKIIAVSRFDREAGIHVGIPADRMVVIHNGVFPEDLPVAAERNNLLTLGVPSDAKVVLAIGYFYKNKGFPLLIEAATGLPPDAHLLIIGDGPELESAKVLRDRLRLHRVHLPGAIPNASRFLGLADVVALPSLKEGLPYVLLEAMASGRPVIATRVGGMPEIVVDGQNGLLVPAGDREALRGALIKLLDDSDYAFRLATEGQAIVGRAFQGRQMCEQTDELYASLDS